MALAEFRDLRPQERSQVLQGLEEVLVDDSRLDWLRKTLLTIRALHPGRQSQARLLREIETVLSWAKESSYIDPNTFKRFLNGTRSRDLGHLALFVVLAPEVDVCPTKTKNVIEDRRKHEPEIIQLFAEVIRNARGAQETKTKELDLATESKTFTRLLQSGAVQPRAVNDFFPNTIDNAWPRADQSYYLLFRYSTMGAAVLKTFLVIETPQSGKVSSWSFRHFNWGGTEERFAKGFYRETIGAILNFGSTYFLLGAIFPTHNKRVERRIPGTAFKAYSEDVRGIEMICFEQNDIGNNLGLFSGVTISQAATSQPIVARVAALHLGSQTKSRVMWDDEVSPTEHPDDQFELDFNTTLKNLAVSGYHLTGSEVAPLFVNETFNEELSKDLLQKIRTMIDNRSAGETDQARAPNRGAIETYAKTFRPRP